MPIYDIEHYYEVFKSVRLLETYPDSQLSFNSSSPWASAAQKLNGEYTSTFLSENKTYNNFMDCFCKSFDASYLKENRKDIRTCFKQDSEC